MKCMFLEKVFLASRTVTIKKEIYGIRQHSGETLHKYWERFNKLYATCPHHQINEQLLIQYFYEGLTMMDRSMIDAASGGSLIDKTPVAARQLISNMASNTQYVTAKFYGICTSVEHPIDMCPTLQETESDYLESVVTSMGSNRIKVGHLIINSLERNHFGQGRVRDHVNLNDSDLP
ncbi:hypothetical protein CR513_48363, partial [Mucuna pruriens]